MRAARSVRLVEGAVRALREARPLLPVTVVVPSHLLGQWLAPRLFADTGHLAIDFVLLPELAWTVAAPRLLAEGRARVPENVDLALLLDAAAEAARAEGLPPYLKEAVSMRGFGAAALRTLRELAGAEVGPDHLEDAPAVDADRLRLLARLARGLDERLRAAGLVERTALYAEAATALPSAGIGGVVLCDAEDASPAALAFVEALARHHPVAAVALRESAGAPRRAARGEEAQRRLGRRADRQAREAAGPSLARLQSHLFDVRTGENEARELDSSVGILAAAGEALEAVEIAREVRRAVAGGVRLSEIAVFLHDSRAYAAHLASAFERAGLAAFFVEGLPRVDPAARALGLLLDLVGGDLERRRVMEFLTSAQVNWPALVGKERPSPARWDRFSAEAGIVAGLAAWRERLAERRADLESRRFDDDVRSVDSLLRVVERLATDLAAFPVTGGWQEFLAATVQLLDGWIRRGALTRERLERVLGPLAERAPGPSREEFLARVRELIATQTYREGSLGDERVLVAPVALGRGLSFRLVFVPGLVERSFPGPARPDPLLLDEEREALSPRLPTTRDAVEEERLLFADVVQVAEERLVLSFPRFETSSGRVRFPSSFLLQAMHAASGRRCSAEELLQLAQPGATGLGRAYPAEPDLAIDHIERDLALVASGTPGAAVHLVAEGGTLARARALDAAAWEPRLTAYDGLVDLEEGGARGVLLAGSRSSASAVEDFADCPYRHLLSRGFRLREWEEPEHVYQLDGAGWGQLYHAVVTRLFEWLRDCGALPLTPERVPAAERQLAGILDAAALELARRGEVLNAALVGPAKGKIRVEIGELLDREAAGDADGFVPVAFEQAYEGLPIELAGGTVTFNGRLDRVDARAQPPAVRVVDYKTGRFDWKDGERFKGGRQLQLAIYNEAVARLYPGASVAEARYYHCTAAARFKSKSCPASPEVAEVLREVLQVLDDTARAGVFAPVADSCEYCSYVVICGAHREERARRKNGDPRLARFLSIRGLA